MGAWGEKPFENDYAMDWMGGVDDFLSQKIHDGLVDESYFHKRAAAQLLIDSIIRNLVSDFTNVKNIRIAVAELDIIVNDKKWLDTWTRPNQVVDDILRQMTVLDGVLDQLEEAGFDE
jgi:hypothetical protein